MPSFIIVGYLWQILGRGSLFGPCPIREQPQKCPSWIGLKKPQNCLLYVLFVRGHYLVQYWFVEVCISYLFYLRSSFSIFCVLCFFSVLFWTRCHFKSYNICLIKVGLLPSKNFSSFNSMKSPLKMMKNAFHFISRALFVLKIFKLLSWIFGHIEKSGLIRKIRLVSKFMTSQSG